MRAICRIFLGCAVLHGMGHLASADICKCYITGTLVFQNRSCVSGEDTQPYIIHRDPPEATPPLESLSAPSIVPPEQT